MSVANVVNISELLNLSSNLTLDQVDALRAALVGQQASEVRQGFTELLQKIEGGDTSFNHLRTSRCHSIPAVEAPTRRPVAEPGLR